MPHSKPRAGQPWACLGHDDEEWGDTCQNHYARLTRYDRGAQVACDSRPGLDRTTRRR